MKLLSILTILFLLSSNQLFAQESPAGNITVSTAGAASWIALTVYAPNVALGLAGTSALGYTSVSLGLTEMANQKLAIKNAVNSDVQQFYNNGTMTEALSQTIKQIKKGTDLSDAEALDVLIQSINE